MTCFERRGEESPDKVIETCSRVIKGPDTASRIADAYFARASARLKKEDTSRAISDYSEAIRRYPVLIAKWSSVELTTQLKANLTSAHYLRGYAYESREDFERVIRDYDQAVSLAPDNPKYRNSACWVRAAFLNRELDRARADCDVAVRLAPTNAGYLDSRGMVGLKQARYQDAWNDYDAAARLKPAGAYYWYGRGIAALRLGRAADGRSDIAKAMAINPKIAKEYSEYGVRP